MNKSLGVSYTIKFTDAEASELTDFMKVNKFEDSPDGVKKLVLHLMRGEIKEEKPDDPLTEFVKTHPKEIFDVGNFLVKAVRKKVGF